METIVYALKIWRHYLLGRKFDLRTDHCGLEHIFTQDHLNERKRQWSELISEYDFDITYIKRAVNRVADALSRRSWIFSLIPLKTNLREKLLELQFKDTWYQEVCKSLREDEMGVPKYEEYSLDNDGVL